MRHLVPACRALLWCLALASAASLAAAGPEGPAAEFSPGRIGCLIYTGDIANPYQVASFFVLPGERVELGLSGVHRERHRLEVNGGMIEGDGQEWIWTAPSEPGLYHGELYHPDNPDVTRVNLFVLVPMTAAGNGSLNGYTIGSYPPPMAGREDLYATPAGLVEVTPANQDTPLSPHFALRQFLSRQDSPFPKYVVLEERLLIALEAILEGVNRWGFAADTLYVMSGYRTPAYNRAIGNVPNSRHVFGDAADIFVDQNPVDGIMDDLNGDGRSDPEDNRVLAGIIEETLVGAGAEFVGGVGNYPATAAHGPFVHVDLRGYRARW